MIKETIIVSDSNIIFDLFTVNLLDDFLKLPCKITTISDIKCNRKISRK